MALETYFIIQAWTLNEDGLCADPPVKAASAETAKAMARWLAVHAHGVLAYSRTWDPETGDYHEPQIVAVHGVVTEEALDGMFR
jgi:hypothetical protein